MEEQLLGRKRFEQDARKLRTLVPQLITPLQDTSLPYTSTSFDGDSFSTTAKTKIDLSATFGVPANVRAVLVRSAVRDSDSSNGERWLCLSPNATDSSGLYNRCSGQGNDTWSDETFIVPCDANGDIYYQIYASGASTMDVILEVWGYWAQ